MIDGAERENAEWMDCKREEVKRMNSNREKHKEHRWALNMCALMSLSFVCAFILFSAIPVSAHSTIHKAESNRQFNFKYTEMRTKTTR